MLQQLNHEFYQNFADDFSATRQRLQQGVLKVISGIPGKGNVLDIGCGNGELAAELIEHGFQGNYLGLDFSAGLLNHTPQTGNTNIEFREADLMDDFWAERLPEKSFDYILSFAVFHHIPAQHTRIRILKQIHSLLKEDGQFIFSNWQFLNSPRLAARVQPWSTIGLQGSDLEQNDYLMDWRRGGQGLRYVHSYTLDELSILAESAGFVIQESFYSDGHENRLGLYQRWCKP